MSILSEPSITCAICNKSWPVEDWCRTPISGELPRGVYQCPQCRFAVKRQGVTDELGRHKIELKPVEAYL